jgi:Xaa-Pro aminopeptidase
MRTVTLEAPADLTWNGYSLAERDRRWQRVRSLAADADLSCIFVPLGNGYDARYLTQIETAAVVLPTDGRLPVLVTDKGKGNDWIADSLAANRSWPRPMVEALEAAGMERGRIGVAGLRGGKLSHVRSPDGVLVHSAYDELVRSLPNATFVDATDVVGRARFAKGDEEIACLRRAAAIAEAGIDELIELARPGADQAMVYSRVMRRMLRLGSEYYPWALYAGPRDGPEPARMTRPPSGRRLEADWLITDEMSAVWGGMVSQEDQPILLGPIPEEWKPVIELQREVFHAGLDRMRPGVALGDFIDFINGFGDQRGMKTFITMHGRGIGDDGPLLTSRSRGDDLRDLAFEAGAAFVWKPYGRTADERISFNWGGDVVVTEHGGELLSTRPIELVSIT